MSHSYTKKLAGFLFILFIAPILVPAHAASVTTETFSVNLSGWSNAGLRSWGWNTGKYARVTFPPTPPGPGDNAILIGSGAASSGSFTGNYVTAGINLVGFDIRVNPVPPAVLTLYLLSGTNSLFVPLAGRIASSNTWQTLSISVRHQSDGPWLGPANEAQFQTWLQNVTEMKILLKRSTDQMELYDLDNLFAVTQPASSGATLSWTGTVAVAWTDLVVDQSYQVQASQDLPGNLWSNVYTLVATNTTMQFIDVDAGLFPFRAYRLQLP